MSKRANQSQPQQLPGLWTLLRDIVSFAGGWVLIFMEVQRPEIRESVLVLAGSVIGVPGLAVGLSTIGEAVRRRNGTDGSPSSSQPEVSSSSS